MRRSRSHTTTCHYEAHDGAERCIDVTTTREGLGHNDWDFETDLSDVPASELGRVHQQAIDGHLAADRAEYLRSGATERNGD